ncbi:thioesterase-like superfamily-domain-containing protein [Pseudomassariella vexata]|uniref:Thioesterase-like superfamily-domain-containing protein n=1 Tax=Pseudomassariella vexata TaxID=1141098 RepID=A0A1Y2DAM4_9PEZI|nr:thioesterase-like superfamily-domain-containing protein [Pseudomassariella vexata]ORY56309.1 thioesterase-like superfamily-domain-containing protein [Pseudomassariella vexata]
MLEMTATFAKAMEVKAVSSHTYTANFNLDWCVGSVPHGGIVTSVLLQVAATHFNTVLAAQKQPHTITLHLEFLRRTQVGPCTVTVRDGKLGRQTSTIHVALTQDGREEVVGYITNSNMNTESGPSFETAWSLDPAPPPVDLARLAQDGGDVNWTEQKDRPFPKFRRVLNRARQYVPLAGQVSPGLCDEWIRFTSGEKFTQESLGLVCDLWPQIIETMSLKRAEQEGSEDSTPPPFWYPTLVLNLDIKKALPAEGVDWLFVRVRAKKIEKGRQDLEVVILDEAGDIVALSHHVALVLSAERNLAKRKSKNEKL